MFFYIFLGSGNGFLDGQTVQSQVAIRSHTGFRRVADNTFLGIKTFFTDIATFYQRDNRQIEMLGKRIVTAVVCRYGHDGTCTVSGQYIITDPYRNGLTRKRIHGIRATEHTGYPTVGNTFTLGTFLCAFQISFHFRTLCFGSQLRNQFTFRCKYHESHPKHGIGTGRKDGKFQITVFHLETDFRSF